ncbi:MULTISPECIES: GNAT family N-acetyltransferase [unclassified Corallococcus]|uniref:GNAT family N-acetyltransferase n=1 Tax=unclassified Corallococcus TaxID=2685029 RepID=UPI001A8F387D|nr:MULTISPECIES: GNAT family N-acetyltransferase [unclassified Corallococcus]MBN9684831.1 GNAT family N-acetyltransferase [Corallococcus sp. NCSPR001]WAS83704.1 GNAT family N-acetyltransferase [Corallococcus sp. NCRR]
MIELDRPVWASLTTFHVSVAEGDERARRFVPEVNLFASARDDEPEAQAALAALVPPGERVYVLQVPPVLVPSGLRAIKTAGGVQMVATRQLTEEHEDECESLTEDDAPEMLALASLTEPGPFLARTHQMGRFLGIRRGGRLAAMAGERMRFPGHTEVSGVCTHPDFRGQGLARRLSTAVVAAIQRRGDRAFLHAWATNTPAIALYRSLGFEVRAEVNVAVLERAPDEPPG